MENFLTNLNNIFSQQAPAETVSDTASVNSKDSDDSDDDDEEEEAEETVSKAMTCMAAER